MEGSDAGGDDGQEMYDDRDDIMEHDEMGEISGDNKVTNRTKDASEALLIPVMMIFLRTGSTIEICVCLGIVIFILGIILR